MGCAISKSTPWLLVILRTISRRLQLLLSDISPNRGEASNVASLDGEGLSH